MYINVIANNRIYEAYGLLSSRDREVLTKEQWETGLRAQEMTFGKVLSAKTIGEPIVYPGSFSAMVTIELQFDKVPQQVMHQYTLIREGDDWRIYFRSDQRAADKPNPLRLIRTFLNASGLMFFTMYLMVQTREGI